MGEQGRRWVRRVPVGLAAVLLLTAGASCSDDGSEASDDDTTIAIGVGSTEIPPAARPRRADASEPAWAARVPESRTPPPAPLPLSQLAGRRGLPAATSASQPAGAPARGTYRGTATVELAYYDRCVDGTPRFVGSEGYEMDAEVFVSPPAEADGLAERSPFNLLIGAGRAVEGEMNVWSATVLYQNDALLDYWDIDLRGRTFTGVLDHPWPGPDQNYVRTAQLLVTCRPEFPTIALPDAMAQGATLSGRSSGSEIELEIVGRTLDNEVRFRSVIEVERRR
jgi:hypothetical protein